MNVKRWLGLDPSIAAFGYAVLQRSPEHFDCIDIGTWRTRIDGDDGKLADRARRVRELGMQLIALLEEHEPIEAVYVEGLALGMKTSRSTAQTLGRVRGLVEGICLVRGLEIAEVSPQTLKQVAAGNRSASKEEVARAVKQHYAAHATWNVDDNATDALAVAHVGAYRHGAGVTVSSGVVRYRGVEADDEPFEVI